MNPHPIQRPAGGDDGQIWTRINNAAPSHYEHPVQSPRSARRGAKNVRLRRGEPESTAQREKFAPVDRFR